MCNSPIILETCHTLAHFCFMNGTHSSLWGKYETIENVLIRILSFTSNHNPIQMNVHLKKCYSMPENYRCVWIQAWQNIGIYPIYHVFLSLALTCSFTLFFSCFELFPEQAVLMWRNLTFPDSCHFYSQNFYQKARFFSIPKFQLTSQNRAFIIPV